MKTLNITQLTEKQRNILIKQGIESINSPIIINWVVDILNGGIARVGDSGKGFYSNRTEEVTSILGKLNFKFEAGNDAPKGGASGFFVKAANKSLLKRRVAADNAAREKRIANAKINEEKAIAFSKERDARFQAEKATITTDAIWFEEKANALNLTGAAKNDAFTAAMKGLLKRNNIEKVEFFYQLMKAL